MAAAVGEGGVDHICRAAVLELAVRLLTASALFICVSASWVFS